jgi:hypothetical protein
LAVIDGAGIARNRTPREVSPISPDAPVSESESGAIRSMEIVRFRTPREVSPISPAAPVPESGSVTSGRTEVDSGDVRNRINRLWRRCGVDRPTDITLADRNRGGHAGPCARFAWSTHDLEVNVRWVERARGKFDQ